MSAITTQCLCREEVRTVVRYVLSVLLAKSDSELDSIPVCYGKDWIDATIARVVIAESTFFGRGYLTEKSLPSQPVPRLEGIPILYGDPRIQKIGKSIYIEADIIASAFFMLTRYEEFIKPDRDPYGRFPAACSLAVQEAFIDRPIVDEYADLLCRSLHEVGHEAPRNTSKFLVTLTHDVDVIASPKGILAASRAIFAGIMRRRSLRCSLYGALAATSLITDPVDNINDIISADRWLISRHSQSVSSIFFFMSGGKSKYDGKYQIDGAAAKRWINAVKSSGAELGLHTSFDAGANPDLIGPEISKLQSASESEIYRNRHHYLRWTNPSDVASLAASGIRWDSTLGFAEIAGFRVGTCRPYPLFCPLRRLETGIIEHPLIIMDRTLHAPIYMGLGIEEALEYSIKLADAVKKHNGELVLSWHPNVFSAIETSCTYHTTLYNALLRHLDRIL